MNFIAPVIYRGFNREPGPILTAVQLPPTTTSCGRFTVADVQGFGVYNGQPFTNASEFAPLLARSNGHPENLIRDIEGNISLIYTDHESGKTYAITDRFGGGKFFFYQSGDRWAVSSSVPDLVGFLRSQGVPMKKSLANTGLIAFVGYGGGAVPSPWEQIECLDQFHYLEIASGSLENRKFENLESMLGLGNWGRDTNESLVEQTAHEITQTVFAASRQPSANYICHLTGGLDSRTVFAGLIASGLAGRYKTHTYGLDQSPDVRIARGLTAEFNMKATSYSGMRFRLVPGSPTTQKLWTLRQTGGLTSMTPASIGADPRPDSVILAGGWGEMYRGGYGDHPDPDASRTDLIKWITNWILRSGSPYGTRIAYGGLFGPNMVELVRSYGESIIDELEDLGIPQEFLPEWLYLRWSARFNVAEITRSSAPFAHRIDPLSTSSMMKVIFATKFEERWNGTLQLDLIRALNSNLAFYPLDKEELSASYASLRNQQLRSFVSDPDNILDRHTANGSYVVQDSAPSPPPTEAQKQLALRLKMPVRFAVNSSRHREFIRQTIEAEASTMSKIFDISKFEKLWNKDPNTRPEFRRLETLSAALSWHID